MKIKLDVIEHFGKPRYYPACNLSRLMIELMGRKTFTQDQLSLILKSGIEIEECKDWEKPAYEEMIPIP